MLSQLALGLTIAVGIAILAAPAFEALRLRRGIRNSTVDPNRARGLHNGSTVHPFDPIDVVERQE
jgi:hypothetical protein